jgi:hypothetical protein
VTAPPASHEHLVSWPTDDTMVLRCRPVRPDTRTGRLSTFGAPRWELQPGHPDAHTPSCTITWSRFPAGLVLPFKAFALAALDHPRTFDRDGGAWHGQYASVATIRTWLADLAVFAHWMHTRRLGRISDVTGADLAGYLAHVQALPRSALRKRDLLHAVRMLWAYREHLPPPARLSGDHPWGPASSSVLAAAPGPGRYNKTPRIATATMAALLAWALHMLEDIGPDIRDAWTQHRLLRAGTHPSQRRYDGLSAADRLHLFATTPGAALPANVRDGSGGGVNLAHLARLVGLPPCSIKNSVRLKATVLGWSLPLVAPTLGAIAGTVNGQPWRNQPIRTDELGPLTRHLATACFILISYLSGMRPGEVLTLRRGCTSQHPSTGELLVHGRRSKGFDRDPLPRGGSERADGTRPWVVVKPVHDAIAMLEALTSGDALFPPSLLRPGNRLTACTDTTRTASLIAADLNAFVAWVNQQFTQADGHPAIPADPTKHLHAARFRRTLAYFIVRRPKGLIACALQYGHVSTKVTLSYAGAADSSWLDDLAVERLEMVLDHVDEDWDRLGRGEHVSGPAATEYRTRLQRAAPFAGRAITSLRNADRLLGADDPNIHHGEGMTCVYRPEQAECRKHRPAQGLATDGPDQAACRSTCQNLAYTDRDIETLRTRLTVLEPAAAESLAPRPLRDRAAEQAHRIRAVIDQHRSSRPTTTGLRPS